MDQLTNMMKGMDAQKMVMTMTWLTVTIAAIWIIDNVLKNTENPMEDTFKHQARNLVQSLRTNTAVLIICLSGYFYVKTVLGQDLHALPGIFKGFLWILSSVGKFLLYAVSWLAYMGNKQFYGPENAMRPTQSSEVLVGFLAVMGYFLMRRLIARRMNPLTWGLVIVFIIGLGAYFNIDIRKIGKNIGIKKKDDTTVVVDTTVRQPENIEIKVDENKEVVKDSKTDYMLKYSDIRDVDKDLKLMIDEFVIAADQTRPSPDAYGTLEGLKAAQATHKQNMKDHHTYEVIKTLTGVLDLKERNDNEKRMIRKTLQEKLCPKYSAWFTDEGWCETSINVYAN